MNGKYGLINKMCLSCMLLCFLFSPYLVFCSVFSILCFCVLFLCLLPPLFLTWVKDESWSNRVRDAVGHPAFGLVNKATGQALRHAPAAFQEVLLTKYEAGSYDESVLWSESEDMGYGYRTIRMVSDIGLNLDAFQCDRKHGGIQEGTRAVLWKWNKQDNQLWKISPCY
ncbi:ricin B-like lectin EULS3 [Cryptomeria japonica]|uniref:ricin B-like lectin EULS3 n=1 Tax=Cryptomeria japonica TaxID=3369 RepID=UPI0025AC4840|nr:ricin B-like lectin EULS3 [Cryptomeria japonica]